MDQYEENNLANRLKEQNDISRSYNLEMSKQHEKFSEVFDSIKDTMERQTSVLNAILETNKLTVKTNEESREKQEVKDKLKSVQDDSLQESIPSVSSQTTSTERSSGMLGSVSNLFSNMFGGLGMVLSPGRIGTMLIGGGAIGILAPIVTDFITDFMATSTTAILETSGLDITPNGEEFIRNFSEAVGRSGLWGSIGLLFGRRTAMIFGIAGGISSLFENYVVDMFDRNGDGIIEAFGLEFTPETFSSIGGVLGGALALILPSIIRSATPLLMSGISSAITTSAITARGASGIAASAALLPAVIGGLAVGYTLFGERIGEWIQNRTWSDQDIAGINLGTLASNGFTIAGRAAQFATLGRFFGPYGMIAGAILGTAIGFGSVVGDWLERSRDRQVEEYRQRVQEFEDTITGLDTSASDEDLNEIRSEAQRIIVESQRALNTAIGDAIREQAETTISEAENILADMQLESDNGITSLQMGRVVSAVLEGDRSAQEELLQYITDRESERSGVSRMFGRSSEDWIERTMQQMGEQVLMNTAMESPSPESMSQFNLDLERWNEIIDGINITTVDEQVPGFRTGTRGFQNFGDGSLAILHGREAVIPEDTEAGRDLMENYDSSFNRILPRQSYAMEPIIEAVNRSTNINMGNIIVAPTTNAPVTQVTQGGSSVSSVSSTRVTSIGSGSGGSGLGRFAN